MKSQGGRAQSSRKVVIVTGTPGTGKTAFSRRLARQVGAKYIPLTQFVSRHRLYSGVDRERKSKIVNLVLTREKLGSLISQTGGVTIVDTHIPGGIVPKRMVKLIFVLRCHPRILESRLKRKGWSASKVSENVLAEILDACLTSAVEYYGWDRVIQLDTSRASISKCVAAAKRILRQPTKKGGTVDWIAALNKDHMLYRYLE
jgi:adenylate kinase